MAHEVKWNKIILEEFVSLACMTKEQEKILRSRLAGYTIQEQAEMFSMSVSKVNKIIRQLKDMYDDVQRYSVLLPPRKPSLVEDYLDNN